MFEKLLCQEVAFFDDKDNSTGALCAKLSGEAASVQGVSYYQKSHSILNVCVCVGIPELISLSWVGSCCASHFLEFTPSLT